MNPTVQSAADATCPLCKAPLEPARDADAETNTLALIDIYAVPLPREEV